MFSYFKYNLILQSYASRRVTGLLNLQHFINHSSQSYQPICLETIIPTNVILLYIRWCVVIKLYQRFYFAVIDER